MTKPRKKLVFTMVELLVVIAVIMILLTLLMPGLNVARQAGKRIQCVNNMKTLGQQFSFYSNDYDSYMVTPRCPPADMWGQLLAFHSSYVSYNAPFLWCPSRSDDKAQNISSGSGYDYGVNYYICSLPRCNIWARLERVRYPSLSAYLLESPGNYHVNADSLPGALRHMGGANILFIDGHLNWSKQISPSYTESPWMEYYIGK
jgi:prepilin-type processing-associated H-X9-DG protein